MSLRLTEEEELELVKKFQETGDMRAFRRLRISLRPLIRNVIKQYMPSSGDMTEGQIASRLETILPQAVKDYDFNSNHKFSTFLMSRLIGNTRNAVSDNVLGAHVPRPEHSQLFRYQQAKRQAELEFGTNPSPENILKVDKNLKSVDEVKRISQYDKRTLIGDAKFGNDDDGYLESKDQFLDVQDYGREQSLSLQIDELRQYQKELNPEEQKVIEEYIFNERTLMDTSLRSGVTTSRVRTIVNNWRKKLEEKGIT